MEASYEPELRGRRAMTDEEILAAIEAMSRGERPADPDLVRVLEPEQAQPISAGQRPKDLDVSQTVNMQPSFSEVGEPVQAPPAKPQSIVGTELPPEGKWDEALKALRRNKSEPDPEADRLLKDLESAQGRDKRKNSMDRMQAYSILAGEAVSSGIGGLDKSGTKVPGRISEGDQKKDLLTAGELQKQNKFKRENPEDERLLKWMITNENVKGRQGVADTQSASKKEEGERKSNESATEREFKGGEGDKNRGLRKGMHDEDIRLGIVKGYWGQGQGANKEGARAGAREAYDQARMAQKETAFGQKYHARGPVTGHQSNNADERMESYSMLVPALEDAISAVEENPRAALMWGSETRGKLLQAFQSAYQSDIKFQGNGVMNGKDLETAIKVLGDPESAGQVIFNTVGSRLKSYRAKIDRQLDAVMHASGYDKGEGEQDLSAGKRNAEQLGGGQHGPVVEADPSEAEAFIKGKGKMTKPTKKEPEKKKTIKWSDY